MEIKHKESDINGMFYIQEDKKVIAELTYTKKDNNIITLNHIEVSMELDGKGIGSKLIETSVFYARENNLKIDPLCPFAEVQFDKHDSYNDVRA